jgi:rhodanese-related sulfurtransferase
MVTVAASRRLAAGAVLSTLMLLGVACQPVPAQAPVATAPSAQAAPAASLPSEITTAEAAARRGAGAFILDVREPEEWADYHVPGSTLIPLGELPSRLNEVPRDKEVIVVCRTGHRSASGRDILLKAGYLQATSLQGGLTKWKVDGLPTVGGQ